MHQNPDLQLETVSHSGACFTVSIHPPATFFWDAGTVEPKQKFVLILKDCNSKSEVVVAQGGGNLDTTSGNRSSEGLITRGHLRVHIGS